jgi:hypothetical protein
MNIEALRASDRLVKLETQMGLDARMSEIERRIENMQKTPMVKQP